MKKYLIIGLMAAMFIFPSFAKAATMEELQAQVASLIQQLQALQQQISSQSATGSSGGGTVSSIQPQVSLGYCPNLIHNFYLGVKDDETGGQVTELQKFLAQDTSVYPEGLITGFFGPMTEQAIKKWQAKHSIVSSGSPDTTGYGVVGPSTRKAMRARCAGQTITNPIISSTTTTITPSPVVNPPTVGQIEQYTDNLNQHITDIQEELKTIPIITVISPNGGEMINLSDSYSIYYSVSGDINKVSIALYADDKWHSWIVKDKYLHNSSLGVVDFAYGWKLSNSISESDLAKFVKPVFKIYIIGYKSAGGAVDDKSDVAFGIRSSVVGTPETLSVDLMVNGSNYVSPVIYNSAFDVTWNSTNLDVTCGTSGNHVPLSNGGLWTSLGRDLPSGGFRKLIARVDGLDYVDSLKLGIQCYGKGGVVAEDSIIIPVIQENTQTKVITVTAPNNGETWEIGRTNTITWTPYDPNVGINHSTNVTAYLDRKTASGGFEQVGVILPAGKASIHWQGEIGTYGKYAQPGSYYIRVVNNVTGATDRSDNALNLVSSGSITTSQILLQQIANLQSQLVSLQAGTPEYAMVQAQIKELQQKLADETTFYKSCVAAGGTSVDSAGNCVYQYNNPVSAFGWGREIRGGDSKYICANEGGHPTWTYLSHTTSTYGTSCGGGYGLVYWNGSKFINWNEFGGICGGNVTVDTTVTCKVPVTLGDLGQLSTTNQMASTLESVKSILLQFQKFLSQ